MREQTEEQKLAGNEQENPAHEGESPEKFKVLADKEQRGLLAERVDQLVQKVATGQVENLVFLDKSARPVATLFLDLWRKEFPDKEAPHINFMNIGSEVGVSLEKELGRENYKSPDNPDDKEYSEWLNNLDAAPLIAAAGGQEQFELLKARYKDLASLKEGAEVLIVDEYMQTGESARLAQKIIKTAFPQVNVSAETLAQENPAAEKKGKALFFNPIKGGMGAGSYKAPWSMRRGADWLKYYGTTGVVDPTEQQLTANSIAKTDIESLKKKIEGEIREVDEQGVKDFEYVRGMLSDKVSPQIDKLLKQDQPIVAEFAAEHFNVCLEVMQATIRTMQNAPLKDLPDLMIQCGRAVKEFKKKFDETSAAKIAVYINEKNVPYPERDKAERSLKKYKNRLLDLNDYLSLDNFDITGNEFTSTFERKQELLQTQREVENPELRKELQRKANELRGEMHALADEYWAGRKSE